MAKILAVDDRVLNVEFLSTLLGYAGHEVLTASDGAEALQIVRAQRPDLVITDVMMPTMGGVEFADRLHNDPDVAHVPIIFYTATYRVTEARALGKSCNVSTVLAKPAEPQEILDAVADALGTEPAVRLVPGSSVEHSGFISTKLPIYLRDLTDLQQRLRRSLDQGVEQSGGEPAFRQDLDTAADAFHSLSLRVAALLELNLTLSSERDPQLMLDTFCSGAQDIIGCKFAAVGLLCADSRRLDRLATRGLSDGVNMQLAAIDPFSGVLGSVVASAKLHRAKNESAAASTLGLPAFHPPINALLCVPVPVRSASSLAGWVYFADKLNGNAFNSEDEQFATTLSGQFALAYGNLILYDEVQRHAANLEVEISERRRTSDELRESDRRFRDMLANVDLVSVMLNRDARIDYCNDSLLEKTGWRREEVIGQNWFDLFVPAENKSRRDAFLSFLKGASNVSREENEIVARSGERRIVRWNDTLLRSATGDAIGMASIGDDVTAQRRDQADLAHSLTHDRTTGLPRYPVLEEYLMSALADAAAHDGRVIVFYVDIDRFNAINEARGRVVGDLALRVVAERLCATIGGEGSVAHVAGDEYAIVLKDPTRARDQIEIGERIRNCVEAPILIEAHPIYATCSVGVSCFPDNGLSPEELLRQSESGMLRAKREGRNAVFSFDNEDKAQLDDRLSLGMQLRLALRAEQLILHYQPRIDGQDWRVCGFEALLRWQNPELGLLPPSRFLPVAEDLGMMVDIGKFVLESACRQARSWLDAGADKFTISVNVSPVQMQRPRFVDEVNAALRGWDLPACYIELELVESVMAGNVARVVATMRALKALGIKISLDDFGTGYSSLNYLRRFPIDTLKIDQSFVKDISTDAGAAGICRTIITLGHQLGMKIVAEGVETAAQVGYLRRNECDYFQGFFFGKAVSAVQALEILRRSYLPQAELEPHLDASGLLLVDDEANILQALTRVLRRDGYQICTASCAEEALDMLGRNDIRVIISDQRMPGMSGTELLSKVKDMYPNTVRMVLSGYTDLAAITDAINEGAIYKFITKPWNDEELRRQVREAFRIAHKSRKQSKIDSQP